MDVRDSDSTRKLSASSSRMSIEDQLNVKLTSGGNERPKPLRQRRSRAGTRTVSTLTAEQLQRKRQNDRESQRAIRERTKNQTQQLQDRISDLELQLERSKSLQDENDNLRLRLAGLLEKLYGQDPQTPSSSSAREGASTTTSYFGASLHRTSTTSSSYAESENVYSHTGSDANIRKWASNLELEKSDSSQSNSQAGTAHSVTERQLPGLNSVTNSPLVPYAQELNLEELLPPQPDFHFLFDKKYQPLQFSQVANIEDMDVLKGRRATSRRTASASSPGALELLGAADTLNSASQIHMPFFAPGINMQPSGFAYEFQVLNSPHAACPVDAILLDFIANQRTLTATAAASLHPPPEHRLIGPSYPHVAALIEPSLSSHPVSKVLTDILGALPEVEHLPERIAILYMMYLVLRWQILPTQVNYERIPDWLTPRPSQITKVHQLWMDYIPWPKMRDRVINDQASYPNVDFQYFFTINLSVNWTGDCLMLGDNQEVCMRPEFERHISNLDNWSIGNEFAQRFPRLAEVARVRCRMPSGSA